MPRDLHPEGLFEAMVTDHGFVSSGAKKTPALRIDFSTDEGTITGWFWLTDKAIEQTIDRVRAIGFTGDSLSELDDGKALRGCLCTIQVKHEFYEGSNRAKIAWVYEAGYQPGIQRDETVLANLKKFNGLLAKASKRQPVRRNPSCLPVGRPQSESEPQQEVAADGTDEPDDNIPF